MSDLRPEFSKIQMPHVRVGVVTARWNSQITEILETGALQYLSEAGVTQTQVVRVPGAFEIPLAAQALLQSGVDAVVALGAVIRGETTHYESICEAVERGCTELQLKFTKPVAFGVITTENLQQALDRAGGKHGNKGYEAAQVALEMIKLVKSINPPSN
ncbi:MAG: 6,7-dimethyl-8-ribityllumazine synthase [Bdellovibrionales bacterium]